MKILVANDGSPGGEKAVSGALDLAKRLDVGVTMVCVEAVDRFPAVVDVVPEAQSEPTSSFEPIVEADKARAEEKGVSFEALITGGHPVQRIIEIVEQGGYDLLVVGHTGHTALYERIIGSVADRLVSLAPCNVMVIK
jgi:nucleotide-binding universal stress UspA family protein